MVEASLMDALQDCSELPKAFGVLSVHPVCSRSFHASWRKLIASPYQPVCRSCSAGRKIMTVLIISMASRDG